MSIKKIFTCLFALLLLVACKPQEPIVKEDKHFSVITPSGAPSLALLDFIDDESIEFEVVDGSDVLAAEFTNAEKDFIIAPINLGINLIGKGAKYTLVSVLTWGNLHLVSGNEHLTTDKIAAFGEAAVPGKIISVVKDVFGGVEIEYFNSVQEVSAALLSDQYQAVVLAEPYLTMTKMKWKENHEGELYELYDLQQLYSEIAQVSSYPQAALFVKNDVLENDLEAVMSFVNKMDDSIERYNNDASLLSERIDQVDLSTLGFANPNLIKKAYCSMALDLKYAYECINEIQSFLDLFGLNLDSSSYIK